MENIIDYSIKDLENLVASAPYSQYHQMLLALKRNELLKSTLYQPYLGSLPELKNEVQKAADKVISIRNNNPGIETEQDHSQIAEEEQITKSLVEYREPETTKPPSNKKKKVKSKKLKHKIKKKKNKKNKKKSEDLSELSAFSRWLLTGMEDGDSGKSKKKKNKKKHARKSIFNTGLDAKPEVISEPLAELLAKQGHKEKSIEMFEKLKMLFPEKKTIYSARIEEINNAE